jgi:hypothetical protein
LISGTLPYGSDDFASDPSPVLVAPIGGAGFSLVQDRKSDDINRYTASNFIVFIQILPLNGVCIQDQPTLNKAGNVSPFYSLLVFHVIRVK